MEQQIAVSFSLFLSFPLPLSLPLFKINKLKKTFKIELIKSNSEKKNLVHLFIEEIVFSCAAKENE